LKAQELNPDQQAAVASLKVEPDIGGQEEWDPTYSNGPLLM
jgi:hypothetical protein